MPDPDELQGELDAMEDKEETVLVRVTEWTEWLPSEPSPTMPELHVSNGMTAFQTLKTERLVDLNISGTGKSMEWDEKCETCEGEGKLWVQDARPYQRDCPDCNGMGGEHFVYNLYAFQAVLAQNASQGLADSLRVAQSHPLREELSRRSMQGRDRRDDLVVVQRQGNRRERRRKKR
jgi:hypothetical protein